MLRLDNSDEEHIRYLEGKGRAKIGIVWSLGERKFKHMGMEGEGEVRKNAEKVHKMELRSRLQYTKIRRDEEGRKKKNVYRNI